MYVNTDYYTYSFSYSACDYCDNTRRPSKQKDCEHTLCEACNNMFFICPVCTDFSGKSSFKLLYK